MLPQLLPLCLPLKTPTPCSVVTTACNNTEEPLDTSALIYRLMIRDLGEISRTTNLPLASRHIFEESIKIAFAKNMVQKLQVNSLFKRAFEPRINRAAGSGKSHRSIVDSRHAEDSVKLRLPK